MPKLRAASLRRWRRRQGLSQTDVAERLALSQPHIANIEAGRRPLTPRLARQLADAYPGMDKWLEKEG